MALNTYVRFKVADAVAEQAVSNMKERWKQREDGLKSVELDPDVSTFLDDCKDLIAVYIANAIKDVEKPE